MSDSIGFVPHSAKQDRALFSKKRITVVGAGTQYGKTQVGALRMAQAIFRHTGPDDAFLITSPNYKTLHQSTLPAFLKFMDGHGTYSHKDEVFRIHGGGIVYCRTETDPDSIIGITNVRHIWGDEAGKYRLYFWENIQARADLMGCPIDLTTSPYALNWIYKELIKPVRAGKRPDVELIQAASWENPYHSLSNPERLAEKRATMDPRRFNMIYGGEWGQKVGLVYDCWEDEANLIEEFKLPEGTRYFGGIDWGYHPDPFALKVRAVTPDGRHYGVSEFVSTFKTISDIVKIARVKKETFGIETFWADPSQPGYIEEMNRAGLSCVGADNDIRRGIDLQYELIKSRRYKEFSGKCPHSADEREQYHYPEIEDLGPDDDQKEVKPVDQWNHCMDVDRYLTLHTGRISERKTPRVPEVKPKRSLDPFERIDQRIRKRKGENASENWS